MDTYGPEYAHGRSSCYGRYHWLCLAGRSHKTSCLCRSRQPYSRVVCRSWQNVATCGPDTAGEAKQVAYVGDDRQIRELWFPKGGKWTYTDLSTVLLALPVGF